MKTLLILLSLFSFTNSMAVDFLSTCQKNLSSLMADQSQVQQQCQFYEGRLLDAVYAGAWLMIADDRQPNISNFVITDFRTETPTFKAGPFFTSDGPQRISPSADEPTFLYVNITLIDDKSGKYVTAGSMALFKDTYQNTRWLANTLNDLLANKFEISETKGYSPLTSYTFSPNFQQELLREGVISSFEESLNHYGVDCLKGRNGKRSHALTRDPDNKIKFKYSDTQDCKDIAGF